MPVEKYVSPRLKYYTEVLSKNEYSKRCFIEFTWKFTNGYLNRNACNTYIFIEFNNKFCDGIAEIWTNNQFGWYIPPSYVDVETIKGYLHSSTNYNNIINVTSCNQVGFISKELNKQHRVPSRIEQDLELLKKTKKELESKVQ